MIRIFGILFITLYMAYMFFIGGAFTNKQGSYSYQFLIGYIIFSCCVALGGIVIQFLNLSWWLFVVYLGAVYGVLTFVALGKMATSHKSIIQSLKIKDFFNEQWFILLASFILTVVSVSSLVWIWGNNSSDDGYYLSLVGSLPYSPNTFYTAPATGFPASLKDIGTYIVNTIYSEYAVYSFFTGIKAPLFCRIYMSFFNYFLYGSSIVALAEKVFKQFQLNIKRSLYQYSAFIMLFFGLSMAFMENYHIMHVYDDWQFNTAMYYGSSIVRMMSILWIVVPFFDKDRISSREVILVAGIGLALISKSTIALPLMIIIPVSYVITYWFFSKNPFNWLYATLLAIAYLTISIFLGDNNEIQVMVNQYWGYIKDSILFIPSIVIIFASCLTRNKYIIRYNAVLMIILAFMVVSPFNNIFEKASVLNFVAARALATWYYTVVVSAAVYLVLGLFFIARIDSVRTTILVLVSVLISIYLPFSDSSFGDSALYKPFLWRLGVLMDNPECIPASTVTLGQVLEERYQETGQLNVLAMVEGVRPNGYLHYTNAIVRSYSPHTVSLTAASRFGKDTSNQYGGFDRSDQNNFNYFVGNPVDDTYNIVANILDEAHCNMIIMNSEVGLNGYSYAPFLSRGGFELYKVIEDQDANVQYFVFVRNI